MKRIFGRTVISEEEYENLLQKNKSALKEAEERGHKRGLAEGGTPPYGRHLRVQAQDPEDELRLVWVWRCECGGEGPSLRYSSATYPFPSGTGDPCPKCGRGG